MGRASCLVPAVRRARPAIRRLRCGKLAAKGGVPLVCLTAYTAPVAELLDERCDILLVGDSVGMVVHGLPNTVGVTMEMMILHGQAVMRGSRKAMVVVDMPFGSYEESPAQAFRNAATRPTGDGGRMTEASIATLAPAPEGVQ